MKNVSKLVAAAMVALLALVGVLIFYLFGAQLGRIGFLAEFILPGIVSSESFKRAVMHPGRDDAYRAYAVLSDRKSPVARDIAMQHLRSDDDYLWMNAAHYLGCIGERDAVPYLIKALRHTSWRANEQRIHLLIVLTGQDFGTDFAKWKTWWVAQNPQFEINWESQLGSNPRTAEIGGSNESQPIRSETNRTSSAASSGR